ncbi:DUF2935 domain-containing protein [Velocimicrobium porci]|uniref:DUF2935 domain-containing protein n=1 Tax=Velocimicrobium porci TaxID=2606634 RepID=A0A6L5XZA6_9FIRM|nr:DUF2935 domain-containing protein [Velocimicrobium porci]MSS63548.1 DUF2935 domain-containing protein [Velocimicrobium porci]
MENYATLSLETHLFFSRIMKEHGLFLEAGFPCVNQDWIQQADWFRQQFENLLRDTVNISNGRVNQMILKSEELVTEFTIPAERRTECLSGIPIDSKISIQEQNLSPGCRMGCGREVINVVHKINQRAIRLLDAFIDFKESILAAVSKGTLFNANYPLLIKHILREAKLYRATVEELLSNKQPSYKNLRKTEEFWNRIMMEHALFIRGLLDPSETELIKTADKFAMEYQELLEKAREQDCRATFGLTGKSLEETLEYRKFKEAGANGILNCEISSIILPLLADHVLREANHYIRLLQSDCAE